MLGAQPLDQLERFIRGEDAFDHEASIAQNHPFDDEPGEGTRRLSAYPDP
jgi:hypothetical protein